MPDLLSCAVCGGTLKPRQRRCCSRRCALRLGPSPKSLQAREQLSKLLARVPRHVHDGSLDGLKRYMDIHKAAMQAYRRRAGWRVCGFWIDELGRAATP